jgi:hypothetical protein
MPPLPPRCRGLSLQLVAAVEQQSDDALGWPVPWLAGRESGSSA